MKVFLLAFISVAFAMFNDQEMVNHINGLRTTWTAGLNEGSAIYGANREQVKKMMGALKGGPKLPRKTIFEVSREAVPDSFDSATNWPNCPTMKVIRDQSSCGTCWAFAAVEAMSDRYCVFLKKNVSLSAAGLGFCCNSCGGGCNGGYPAAAWQYWVDTGIVEEGCWPYPFPSCDHHIPNSKNPCPSNEYPNARCTSTCVASWSGPSWRSDLHYGSSAYTASGEDQIMAEIYKNGPVETAFTVYEDFLTYKSGVYRHQSGSSLGGHAVKIVGWGTLNGVKYWKIANSWNPKWGDNGYFLILRGTNECGIEEEITAGVPEK